MDIKLKALDYYGCRTEFFTIDGIESELDWFVDNYDSGGGTNNEWGDRGCSNRVTEFYSVEDVRSELPDELQYLTDDNIRTIQEMLENELISGYCCDCN